MPHARQSSHARVSPRNCSPRFGRRLGMERQHLAISVGLMPHRLARGQDDRPRIAKSTHAAQTPEVMVERAVFLRKDDDMFDVPDRARAMMRGKRECPTDALRKRRRDCDAAQSAEEIATVSCHCDVSLAVILGVGGDARSLQLRSCDGLVLDRRRNQYSDRRIDGRIQFHGPCTTQSANKTLAAYARSI